MFIAPTIGETITSLSTNNTFTIGKKIGEGHFGIVYECTDFWNNGLAVKVLKPNGTYEKVRTSAEAEFMRLLQLRHPYITFVYDAFEFRDTFYIITEKCHGPISELFDMPKFNGMLWLKPLTKHLLQAVHYLHLNNYVHQDIHEGNVFATFVRDDMVTTKNAVMQFKLGDLGVTKLISEVDFANTRAQWMLPPEILDQKEFGPIDSRIDIYHIGLLLLQIACSKRIQFSKKEILSGKPRELALKLQPPYSFAIEKALRRHVSSRTASAMELWGDLNCPTV
ncbi:MAG: hypothetical protein GQF41_3172 [Candidatus Rifleibacterium amylolyticum]|nr:MAG: hypothetical protein GQF41_3172 [Candidatus Rifleibacterium amylolyticum]